MHETIVAADRGSTMHIHAVRLHALILRFVRLHVHH